MAIQTLKNQSFLSYLSVAAVSVLLTLVSANGFAETKASFEKGARSAALGGAATASGRASDAVVNNPATLVGGGTYTVDAGYAYRNDGHTFNVSVVDSKTNPMLAAGVGYSFVYGIHGLSGVTGHDVHAALSFPLYPGYISAGVTGSYTWMFQTASGGNKLELMKGFNVSAGVLATLFQSLRIGFSANNMIPICKKDECKSFQPFTLNTGIAYTIADFTVTGEVDVQPDREKKVGIDFGGGLEYVIAQMVPVRIGYRRVGVWDKNVITAGLGFQSDYFDATVSYQGDVSHKGDHAIFVNFGAKL